MKVRQIWSKEWLRKHLPLLTVVVSFVIIGGITTWLTHADASNVNVNFNSTVAVLPPYPVGTDISTYGSGLVTAAKESTELENLGVTFEKVPIQYHNGSPVSSAGGDPNGNISASQWISSIEATGATPEIVIGGGQDNTIGTNGSSSSDDDFTAQDAANLVTYFDTDYQANGLKKPVTYYAIGNEPDGAGMSVSDYCTLFNAAATKMKAVDPTIKIDGPTFSFYSESSMQQFLTCAGNNVDILDFHAYGTGGPNPKDDATLLSETDLDGQYLTQLRQMINQTDPSKASAMQMQVGELNLAWEYPDGYAGWDGNGDTRFFDPFNTVWSAATIGSVLEAGGRAMQYGDQNGALGLLFDSDNSNCTKDDTMSCKVDAHYSNQVGMYDPMPIYYGMGMFTGFSGSESNSTVKFQGFGTNSVSATSSIPNVDVFASSNNDDIVLVNKNPSTTEAADISLTGFSGGTADVWQTNNVNPYTYPTEIASNESVSNSISVSLPGYSVTTITLNGGSTTTTTPSAPTISAISSGTPTTTGTTITWTTDQASTSQVQYGTTNAYGSSTTEDTATNTSHSVTLTGLSANTPYHYRVISTNSDGQTSTSSDATFTTASSTSTPTPPTPPSPPASTTLAVPFRINAGDSSSYKDANGNTWLADTDYTGGSTDDQAAGKTIKGTSVQAIYQDERYGTSFSYSLPVANGTYKLQLDFAEIYPNCQKAGCRVFNVAVNGTAWLNKLDIAAQVGSYTALTESENVTVTNGKIAIAFTGVTGSAQLAGIEVTTPSTTPTPPVSTAVSGAIVGIGNKCLDDKNADFQNSNTIWLYTCNKTNAQDWTIPGDGTIRLDNNKYCLDVKNAGTVPGTPVDLYSCTSSAAEQWVINSNGSISNPHSGLCLDDEHSGTANGNPIWLYTCNGTNAQKWTVPKS